MGNMLIKNSLSARGFEIAIMSSPDTVDYVSITDIARFKNPEEPKDVVKNWMRLVTTLDYLTLWEQLNNPNFKGVEFDPFGNKVGTNAFTMSPRRWITLTNAIGILSKSGNSGGTYAHIDIALEFASWISPEFKLYIIKDYQRLKQSEAYQQSIEWNVRRELAKANYIIQTDAIKEHLIPSRLTKKQKSFAYANEADVLNVALLGKTAKEFRTQNPELKGNQRDYATIEQNIIMTSLESQNALLISQKVPQPERLETLRANAVNQLNLIADARAVKKIKEIVNIQEKSRK
jgi:hypothetical protein